MLGKPTRIGRVITYVVAYVIAGMFAIPLVSVLAQSGAGQGFITNYADVLTKTPFMRFLVNSTIISAGTIVVVFVTTMLSAYAFSKLRFRGSTGLYRMFLVGLMLPSMALIVPIFIIVTRVGLYNTHIAVVIPLSVSILPFTILLARTFMDDIPNELLEAARIDGASTIRALYYVVLPLSKPISAVVIVWTFLQSWNEFFLPLLLLSDPDMQVITQVPLYFVSDFNSDTSKVFASLVLISLPVVIAYLCFQRLFERGLIAGAVK
ncbi:carbohydrate ABC transporter permease [Microbacterium immunditiarum]|uniref:Raffinose/stachyose/melibiose transport system permease protein n=1 Tax=Microbacterium immunditiarum TaxID=337480 RepID=A0A7Y9GMF2_9MICO|nr:carbohydrate ABC transporter permease [Microbacterium immunditiarum]NYE18065.1 raffinose/stachyose/melibiose transport system permease protein [Microbacterium immunditiarum]